MKRFETASKLWGVILLAGAVGGVLLSSSPSISAPPSGAKTTAPGKSEHKVTSGTFRVEVKLSGTFEAEKMTEVTFPGEVLTSLKVVKCLPHGTRAAKGDTLVWADTDKTERTVAEKAASVEAGTLALAAGVEELRRLEQITPQWLAQFAESDRRAAQDLEYFTKVSRPLDEKGARLGTKTRADYLAYSREELRQLKKMYEADDLTEETEEIVLRRQRDAVGRAEFALQRAKAATDHTLKSDLPRKARDQALARKTAAQHLASQKTLLPLTLAQKRLAVAKLKRDHAKAVTDLADLRADLAKMAMKAPAAGVVYYGRCTAGKWSATPALLAKLAPNGTLTADEVIMTIVETGSLAVRASAPETELHNLRAGLAGRAVPAGYPATRLKVKLASVMTVPLAGGKYDVKLTVTTPPGPVMPGMTCAVTLTAYEADNAVTVPSKAVRPDPADADKHVVYVKTASGRKKRPVKVGRTGGGKTEILSGLAKGDVVFLEGAN